MQAGPLPALLLARAVAPAMAAARSGLLALVSFDTQDAYCGDIFYDAAKAAANRLAFAFARELSPYGVTALGLSPGSVATERALDVGEGGEGSETPLYAGRALAALAADPKVAARAGRVWHVGDLARRYGFTDADGSQPPRLHLD
jgi:NAD(P)-dependent dehydrogenase (short-subunit alcohol dehydrogenase family)